MYGWRGSVKRIAALALAALLVGGMARYPMMSAASGADSVSTGEPQTAESNAGAAFGGGD